MGDGEKNVGWCSIVAIVLDFHLNGIEVYFEGLHFRGRITSPNTMKCA